MANKTPTTTSMEEGLEVMSRAVRYRVALARMAVPFLGSHPIEIGSGTGDYAELWATWGTHIVATEPVDTAALNRLQARFADDQRVEVRPLTLPSRDSGEYSAVIAYNVLEHIQDDVAALKSMANLLNREGYLILIVPAFPFAYGEWDRRIGHYRRYRKRELYEKLLAAGFTPIDVRYINSVGLLAWWIMVRIMNQQPRDSNLLQLYDRTIIPIVFNLERRLRLPFGQSIFAIAQRWPSP